MPAGHPCMMCPSLRVAGGPTDPLMKLDLRATPMKKQYFIETAILLQTSEVYCCFNFER